MKTKNTGTPCPSITKEKTKTIRLGRANKKNIEVSFDGGDITSDGGVILLREANKRLQLCERLSMILKDPRDKSRIDHSLLTMLKQRIFGIALGYEDLNDHVHLRKDPAVQSAVDQEKELASTSTIWRMEQNADREAMAKIHELLFDIFIKSFDQAPKEIILDFDATDDLVHGKQDGSHYNGYYKNYCFLPLYVFCGDHLLAAYLRPSNQDGAKHSWAILSLLVKNIRKVWPTTKIVFRGDSGFCRHKMLTWCDNNDVDYVVGIGQNNVLLKLAEPYISRAKEYYDHTQEKQRIFVELKYGAKSWDRERRIILKAEELKKGSNPRFVVTNRSEDPQSLYEKIYCARGNMENRIKEQQLDLFADRTSCHQWWPNQLRMLFSAMAYVLISCIKKTGLASTKMANAQPGTIREKLFKIGAAIVRNTRRIRFLLSSWSPYRQIFLLALARLAPS